MSRYRTEQKKITDMELYRNYKQHCAKNSASLMRQKYKQLITIQLLKGGCLITLYVPT